MGDCKDMEIFLLIILGDEVFSYIFKVKPMSPQLTQISLMTPL